MPLVRYLFVKTKSVSSLFAILQLLVAPMGHAKSNLTVINPGAKGGRVHMSFGPQSAKGAKQSISIWTTNSKGAKGIIKNFSGEKLDFREVMDRVHRRWDPFLCGGNRLTATFYNTPFEKNRRSWISYKMFFDPRHAGSSTEALGAVNVEGSGIDLSGMVVHFNGYREKVTCPGFFGEPTVRPSNEADCLIPFFTVAADASLYPQKTILFIRELAGRVVYLPPYHIPIVHPGYVMVADTGSAIRGAGRVDFYVGSYEQADRYNVFGTSSLDPELKLGLRRCNMIYEVIPYSKSPTSRWHEAYRIMMETVELASEYARSKGL